MASRTSVTMLAQTSRRAAPSISLRTDLTRPSRTFTTLHRSQIALSRSPYTKSLNRPRARLPSEQRHAFTASSTRLKTVCLTKPKLDMGGNEMTIEITPKAGQRLSDIMEATNNPGFALRIRVQSGGCHGFQYLTTNETIPEISKIGEDESIFRYVEDSTANDGKPEEISKGFEGPKVILDEASLLALQGSKVDFIQELIGSKFEIVDNPGAANSCGCGSSFSLKL